MSKDLFKVNANDIIGGAGRLAWAPYGVELPKKISDAMDLSTYDLLGPWKDLGSTMEGITLARSYEEEGTQVDQVQGDVESSITNWVNTLSTQLAENNMENRQLALVGSPIIETPPTLGTAVKIKGALAVGGTILSFDAAPGADFKPNAYVKIGTETIRIAAVQGNIVTLEKGVTNAYAAATDVIPVKELGTKSIAYGTPTEVPFISLLLISQKKDGTLVMAVFYKTKVSGESKEQVYSKAKRTLPFALNAYAQGGVNVKENIYYEVEQVIS
ncbi:hypothetical protein ACIGHG_23515 [Bacillus sp. NPDC077411]|uniref:hypothetical protein n=1 Tax=Bacillus sp. NPDC077411 TaxID=3363947 RepID=UPI0037C67749